MYAGDILDGAKLPSSKGRKVAHSMKASWRVTLEASREEALLAVDLYNQPRQPRRLEGFLVHMHIAWLYLLQAEFGRDGVDFRYRLSNGHFDRVDGEPRTWELKRCVEERFTDDGPVRKNLELTIALRNKIEHRHQEAITMATSGYAQALLLNYEEELTSNFDPKWSLGEQLRFPIFVGSITGLGAARIEELRLKLPRSTRDFLARFETDLDAQIAADQRYEFRVALVPKLGAKQEADRAFTFVREADLTDEQKKALEDLGKSGSVIVREQTRPIASEGLMRPGVAMARVQERIPFVFNMHHLVRAWHKLECRPKTNDEHPERTDERYCIYDEPHRDYLYTQAFVEKTVREASTAQKFEAFFGLSPRQKRSSDERSATNSQL